MLRRVLCVLIFALVASGCYTEYAVRPGHCRAVFVAGHYGAWGRWHPAHWRCR